jgi:hypothetical protein
MSMFPLQSVVVGAGGANVISFQNIPQTYNHLRLHVYTRSSNTSGGPNMPMQFNADTGSNYNGHYVAAQGSSVFASNFPGAGTAGNLGWCAGTNTTAGIFGVSIVDIIDYTDTSKYKTVKSLNGVDDPAGGTGNNLQGLWSSVWLSTAAINRIDFSSGVFAQYTRADLYGVTSPTVTGA